MFLIPNGGASHSPEPASPPSAARSLGADVLWGLRHALWYAGWFGALAAVAWLLDRRALARYGFTPVGVAAYYLLLAGAIGAVLGVLRPLGRSRWGAAFMGWVAFAMLIATAGLLGGVPLGGDLALMAAGFGLFGLPAGLHTWRRFGAGAAPPAV
ncbi:MAG TPA: hypothetical protein VEZ47_08870 [Gemmatirosa sp.]|nr:hypothetical protein [Gemmatirosa sp.]